MKISVSSKHGQLSDSIHQTIEQKVTKLPKYFDRTTAINVIVDLENTDNPKVELVVSAEETDDFFASNTGSNVLTALDGCVSKLERQLRKHKEKLTNHRSRPARDETGDINP